MQRTVYTPSAAEAPLRLFLKELNLILGSIVSCAPRPALREELISAILNECVRVLKHIWLHSSPTRLPLGPDDIPQLRKDLALLRDFFLARDGTGVPQGVSPHRIDRAIRPLHELVVLMAAPSQLLVSWWERGMPITDQAGAPIPMERSHGSQREGSDDVSAGRHQIAIVLASRNDEPARVWAAQQGVRSSPTRAGISQGSSWFPRAFG